MAGMVEEVYFSEEQGKKSAHYHDCHQIVLVMQGSVQFYAKNAIQQAGPGNLMIFSRYENHSLDVLTPDYKRYVLYLSPMVSGMENRVYSLLLNRPEGFCNVLDISGQTQEFEALFLKIMRECQEQDALSMEMQQLLVNELLVMIYRRLSHKQSFEHKNAPTVYDLQRLLETNFQEQFTLDVLAARYNISISTLSHQFKKLTGYSVMEYLLSCRMAAAKNYLVNTGCSIGEIVEKCGFSDCSNFSRTFKNLTGISPTDFRKQFQII